MFMQYKWFKLNLRLLCGFQYKWTDRNGRSYFCRFIYIFLLVTWDSKPGSSEFSCRWLRIFLLTEVPIGKMVDRQRSTILLSLYFCRCFSVGIPIGKLFSYFLSVFAIFLFVLPRQRNFSFQRCALLLTSSSVENNCANIL